jgi:hypothetical protein
MGESLRRRLEKLETAAARQADAARPPASSDFDWPAYQRLWERMAERAEHEAQAGEPGPASAALGYGGFRGPKRPLDMDAFAAELAAVQREADAIRARTIGGMPALTRDAADGEEGIDRA